jgi:tetratricopeptide (TPR) repeat protein
MSAKTIKSALGLLQDDPDNAEAWERLRAEVSGAPDMGPGDLTKLLEAARRAHEARREVEPAAGMLELEVVANRGTPREPELLAELARVLDEEVLDDARARAAYERLLELKPGDTAAEEALERSTAKRAKWKDLVDRYVSEANGAGEPPFRSALLVSAAETAYRFGRVDGHLPEREVEHVLEILRDALALDSRNRRAELLLERLHREEGRWEELARAIEQYADEATQKEEKIAGWLRLARVFAKKIGSPERAVAAFERVIDLAPADPEATNFLVTFFTSREMWDHLVSLYEGQLATGALRAKEEELGALLQVAMVHWRMRGHPEVAEPWFERVRKLEPAHPGMLGFFREVCTARGETTRLAAILSDAQRAVPEGPERAAIVAEVAKLSEEGSNAQKAIEQWRTVLRQDPRNKQARDALKRLYRQSASWSALTDLLRQELEKLPADDQAGKLALLREVAEVYRDHAKSDSALVTVLSQIVQLDGSDLVAVRELVRVYEALQRWRDLLTMQARQAELEREPSVKAELWRAIARRWQEQFSNVQNAVEAYEKLNAIDPRDREAVDRLKELYTKRRAYKALYELLGREAEMLPAGPERRDLWTEMARLAAERLDLGSQAVALYKRVLDEDPSSTASLDALEKQAERDKDYATVAEVLERRTLVATDDPSRLNVLQKLGTIYSERLHDAPRAMDAWRRVLNIQPGHAKALRVLRDSLLAAGDYDGLTDLYAHNADWEGLVEVLSGAADKATDPPTKIDLSFRSAAIYTEKLGAPERAFRAYERVLSVKPDDAAAAAALVPLYEKDEKWGRLPALYEILLGHTLELDTRLALLAKLVEVTGHQLQDRATAFVWARRAYEAAPEREGALAALEKAARAAGQWAGFVEVVAARLSSLEASSEASARTKKKKKRDRDRDRESEEAGKRDGHHEARLLKAKLAEVYAREMGRVDEAVSSYRALVTEDDTDEIAVQTLDRVLREADRRDDLRWLFELRVERANTAMKLDLLSEWAMLEEEAFAAPERSVALYRRMLEIVPNHGGALRALARLLRAQGDAEGAVEVIALDRDQREGAERASREIEIARLLLEPLHRYAPALDACERALALSPNDAQAIEVVEQLLPFAETRARAAAILERAYDAKGDAARQAQVLEVLIATTGVKPDRLGLYARLADVEESKLSDAHAAFDVVARAVREFPAELSLWDRLSALAAKSGRTQALVEAIVAVVPPTGPAALPPDVELDLAERAASLYDEKLGDLDNARPYLERMLALEPGSERAFQRLKQILTTREQWEQLAALYEQVVTATSDTVRRAELLAEVALVAEDITGDRAKAVAYYERILEIQPDHEQATKALESLYASEQLWDRLASLLERRLSEASGEEKIDLEQRLGTLIFERLGDAAKALPYLERVLRERVGASEARQLVEKILGLPPLREQAAVVLEAVYSTRDDVADLVRVLEIRLEFVTEADERRGLLGRVAELRDERLRDDAGALEAYARLVPLDPDDGRARHRLLDIARRTSAHERAAEVLASASARANTPMPKAEILMDLAKLYEHQLSDVKRAEAVYRDLLDLAPTDASIALPPCRALEHIYAAAGDNRRLADVLRVQVSLEDDAAARRELRGRLGEICEIALDDPAGAIQAWRARLEDDPGDTAALAALDRLYERTASWRELVEVLRARERLADDKNTRRGFMVRVATTLADKLKDVTEAILAYRTVIDDFGADRGSLAALVPLYESAERWEDLADVLEADLGLAENAADKLPILARLGEVRKRHLEDDAGAIEAYRQALVIDPGHPASRAALEAMLEDPAARREAAVILRPLYEAEGQNESLLKVLDIEAQHADSVLDKLQTIAQAAQVAEGPLGNKALAFEYASRGLRDSAAEPDLPSWIERAERLAASAGKFAELVELLRSVVGEILDGDVQLDVTLRIAELGRTKLGDNALAKEFYAKALDLRGDDRRALVALESLYEQTGDQPALLEIVKRRVDAAADDAERKQLLFKQARLSDEKLGEPRAAIAVYEQILEAGLEPDAVGALERLYANAERWEDLVSLYERQIEAPGTSASRKASLHHALGDVLDARLKETERAFEEYAAALAIDPKHEPTVASLEALLARRDHAGRAAEMLEPVYLARLDWRRVMSTLEARLEASQDPDDRRQLLRRLSKMHEEQAENYGAALETTAKLLAEDPTDETTWAELERLARVANAEGRLAEIFASELEKISSDEPATARLARRTGELFEAQKDVDRALKFYRRAYVFDPPAGATTFEAIDRLLKQSGRARERVELYREALDFRTDPQERLKTLHAIALLEETDLHDDTAAVDTYRAALDVDESDAHSLEALSRLLARTARWRDLADLTRRRAEQSAMPDDEAKYRMELAKLLLEKLSDAQAAIDELQAVVGLVPPGPKGPGAEAVRALEQIMQAPEHKARVVDILRPIYEQADDWRQMVAVNEERLALATDGGDRIGILRESARLWEERGHDNGRAFDAIRAAWTLDPEDGETREQLDRLAGVTKRWDDLGAAYEQAIAKTDGLTKRELLSALARLHDSKRDDLRRALDAWDRLFALDPSDIQPLEEMDPLATLLSDWPTLVKVLTRKADLLPDDESRATTWRRLGEARRDMLDDVPGAIAAYERALELEPESASTLDRLIGLHEERGDATRLVDLYRRRVELAGAGDDALKFDLLVKAARLFERELSDRREAIDCLSGALGVRPGNEEVLRALDRLYTEERLWPELLDNLKLQASVASDDTAKRDLKKRIAALHMGELQEPQAALEAYRDVLSVGFDADAAAAIRKIGEAQDDLRAEAAGALEPVLRQAGRYEELADVLELKLRAETEAVDRARTLRSLAEVAEAQLGQVERAEAALLRALSEEPHDASLHAEIERLAAKSGAAGWRRYADALNERANSIFDASVAADLFVRLGRVAEEKLEDASRAAAAYAAAAERLGDDSAVLKALDRLFEKLGDKKSLAEVLERRIGVEPEPSVQVELLHRLAGLQIDDFAERAQGLGTLRKALERVPDHAPSRAALEKLLDDDGLFEEAFEALEFVLRTLALSADLAKLYERRVGRAHSVSERTRARLDLARVLEESVKDKAQAQRAVESAVREDPTDQDALTELERLAAANGGWEQAAQSLAEALDAASDLSGATRAELWIRLAGWRRDKVRDDRGAENAYAKALEIEPDNVEVLRALEDIRRAPGRERDLVETLRTRARLETDLGTKRDLLREAKTLAQDKVGDRALAEATLRDLLTEDEGDLWALEELTNLRREAGDEAEAVKLLMRRAELVTDGAEALRLKHEAAKAYVQKLSDPRHATSIYEEILDLEPGDAEAAAALRKLYGDAGRDKDLARLLLRLVDIASTPSQRAVLRLELAKLHETRFHAPEDAIEALRAILDEEPSHADAVIALSQLYESTGRDAELADLLRAQLDAARDRKDLSSELTLLVRLGEVQEGRLNDVGAAQETYELVLARDPEHRGALEAVARMSEKRGDWERASGALSKLLDLATDASGVALALRLAEARDKLKDAAGAEAALKGGLKLEPSNAGLRAMLRVRWEKEERWAELAELLVGDADLIAVTASAEAIADDVKPAQASPPGPRKSIAPSSMPPPPSVPAKVAEQVKLLRRAAEIHLIKRKQPQEAIPILERAAQLVPQDRELLLVLCDAYSESQRGREAAQVLEKVIASFGNKRTKELALYHHRLARALSLLGDKDVALTQLDMAFKIDPGSVNVLRDLGVLAFETNDLERAQKTFRALLLQRLDAGTGISKGEVFYYLGEISIKQGDKAKAVQMFERAIENDPALERARTKLTELKG